MTITPKSTKRPEDMRLEQAEEGIYTIKNAYEDKYEYFKDRPLLRQIKNS